MNTETYNMLALGGLLLGKLILLSILVCYCCKTRRKSVTETEVADSADQTDVTGAHLELEKQLRKEVEEMDKPPKYKSVVLRVDPPEYLESVINAQINPELNWRWAEDLDKGEVDKEIEQIISRSRENSIVAQLKRSRFGCDPESEVSDDPTPTRGRSNTTSTINELPLRLAGRQRNRNRTISLSPPVGTIWIGV